MKSIDTIASPNRRNWLEEAERDLAQRMEHRVVALEGGRHMSDPLYQRLRGALSRVRRELAQAATAPDPRPERFG